MEWEGLDKLIAAAGAAFAAALTPIGVIYAATINRKTKISSETIHTLTQEVSRLEDRLEDAEKSFRTERKEGLRWYQLVILWFNTAHVMRRNALDARQVAETIARNHSEPLPQWSDALHLPHMEEPLPIGSPSHAAFRSV
jgi:arginine/ornithine N-succinyltransferase beta subunit